MPKRKYRTLQEAEWQDFLLSYQQGRYEPLNEPAKPAILDEQEEYARHLGFDHQSKHVSPSATISKPESEPIAIDENGGVQHTEQDEFTPVFRHSKAVDSDAAQRCLRFYAKHRHLPAPKSDLEDDRCLLAKEYVLDGPAQISAMSRYAALSRAIFGEHTHTVVSLFDATNQVVYAYDGDAQVTSGTSLPQETTVCSHVVLRRDSKVVVIQDLRKDWRFKNNPFCTGPWGIKGYIGVPISVPANPALSYSAGNSNSLIPVGVLAVMTRGKALQDLGQREFSILSQLAEGLSRELSAYRVDRRRRKELHYRQITNEYLNRALVQSSMAGGNSPLGTSSLDAPSGMGKEDGHQHKSKPSLSATSSLTPFKPTMEDEVQESRDLYSDMVKYVQNATSSDVTILLDVSMIHRSSDNNFGFMEIETSRSPSVTTASSAGTYPQIIATEQRGAQIVNTSAFSSSAGLLAITRFLQQHAVDNQRIFFKSNVKPSPLEGLLGTEIACHMVVPLYSALQPHLLLIVGTLDATTTYLTEDVDWLLGMGAIVQASLLRTRLVEADRAKTTFISQVTHELRTPLHGLITQLDFMRDAVDTGDFDELGSMLQTAISCGVALSDIINDVLDFGKISISSMETLQDHDQQKKAASERDILDLVEASAKTCLSKVARQQKVLSLPEDVAHITFEYEERNPEDWQVYLDAPAIQRVLFNLMTNAIKYCKKGASPQITLRLRIIAIGGTQPESLKTEMFEITCVDEGLGMSPDFLAGIFQPFRQANVFSPGAGLGLYITHSLVRRLSGTISVESQENVGTSFKIHLPVHHLKPRSTAIRFDLPLARKHFSSSMPRQTSQSPSTSASTLPLPSGATDINRSLLSTQAIAETKEKLHPGLRVLVVDDNKISRSIMVTIVKRLGIQYAEASDGVEAYEEFERFRPQLVWTDVSMPRMDGITAASRMRLREKELKLRPAYIVALTGLGSSIEYAKKEGVLGTAALDEWQVKGQTKLNSLRDSISKVSAKLFEADLREGHEEL